MIKAGNTWCIREGDEIYSLIAGALCMVENKRYVMEYGKLPYTVCCVINNVLLELTNGSVKITGGDVFRIGDQIGIQLYAEKLDGERIDVFTIKPEHTIPKQRLLDEEKPKPLFEMNISPTQVILWTTAIILIVNAIFNMV